MPNRRTFYATKAPGLAPLGSTSYTVAHGVQTLGMETSFNVERILEIGQSAVYENKEELPDVTVNMTKVLDGYPPIYLLATQQGTSADLIGRSAAQCMMAMSIFPDTYASASGVPIREVQLSGLFVNSVSYTVNVDGNAEEQIALGGNDKVWLTGGNINFTGNLFVNTDVPQAITGSGGVNRRQHVMFGTLSDTVLPTEVAGISSSGTNDQSGGVFGASIQSISISADLNREAIRELGRKAPYFRYVNFPVDVNTSIEIMSKSGDGVNALAESDNVTNQTIKLRLQEGTRINCGTSNKLTSITMGGGDTGGGNDTITYNYVNANEMTVQHPMDPTTAFRP